MNFNELQLGMKSLSSAMVIDNFIIGFQEYSYEDYLRDYLNASPWFRERHPLGFVKPASESKGECDAISDTYGIDFKLLASSTLLQAKSILDHQITVTLPGVTAWNPSKKSNGQINATRIHAALRGLTQEDLEKIRNESTRENGINKDIQQVLQTMEVQKNIFLFFPYELYYLDDTEKRIKVEEAKFYEAVEWIKGSIETDFKEVFFYREKTVPDCETYFSVIFQDYILMFSVQEQSMLFIDHVKTSESPLYTELKNIY